jgi:hypothetical protein
MSKGNAKTNPTTKLSPAELRAAKAERIKVYEAEPYGWIAFSEDDESNFYHLYCDPANKSLECVCADFVFRGEREPNYECKHVSAVLKFIARNFLANDYEPQRQISNTISLSK